MRYLPAFPARLTSRRPVFRSVSLFVWLAASAGLCAHAAPRPVPVFVDLVDYPANEANWDRFYDLEGRLAGGFHAACGNQQCVPHRFPWPMQLRCSVRAADGSMAACVWVIAGSDLRVRRSGSIDPDVVVWRCVLPVPPGLHSEAFHAALDVPDPVQVRLPGASSSLIQAVRDCLSGPGRAS